ncbi:MAG: PilZ domain-containing protein [Candidatus Omnitrophota bacterium]
MQGYNQRRFPRVNFPCSLTVWLDNNYDTILAKTVNISAGGLLVYLNKNLMGGAKVEVRVDFTKGETLRCVGRVVRCQDIPQNQEASSQKLFAVGVAFEGLDEAKIMYLKALIERLLNQENNN